MSTHLVVGNPCEGVTCENGGVCRDNQHTDGGDYICECATGYHGRHCSLQRCVGGATCYNDAVCT